MLYDASINCELQTVRSIKEFKLHDILTDAAGYALKSLPKWSLCLEHLQVSHMIQAS